MLSPHHVSNSEIILSILVWNFSFICKANVKMPIFIIFRCSKQLTINFWPRGKESTEVRITQNIGKESKNSYRKLKRSRWKGTRTHTRKQNRNISMDTAILLNQKRAKCMWADDKDGYVSSWCNKLMIHYSFLRYN